MVKYLSFLLALALAFPASAGPNDNLPDFGTPADAALSKSREAQIGRGVMLQLRNAGVVVEDPELTEYINTIGNQIASHANNGTFRFNFFLVRDDRINAFALPGGYIGVNSGLLLATDNESELAGVLAHEIAHVNQKHHLKVLKKSQAIEIVGGILGSQLAERDPFGARQALLGKGAEALARGLDKEAEFEADHAGVVLATRAGYEPYGLPQVLRRMASRNPRDASLALLFKTHPLPQDRLEKLGELMGAGFDRFERARALPERIKRLD